MEATSDGLSSGKITLSFCDGPRYRENVTPLYSEHSYHRFTREDTKELKTFGNNSPIFASSMELKHTSSMATDNNMSTYWSPLSTDNNPWIMLDTERCINVTSVNVKLASDSSTKKYVIETSIDGENWKEFTGKPFMARFVRIHADQGIKISEMTVQGQ